MHELDLELLGFIAEHRFVIPAHAQAFLRRRPDERLQSLLDAGLLARDETFGAPGCYYATRDGLRATGRGYRVRPIRYGTYQHDIGVAWLWLAAKAGSLGPVREVIAERAMRSHDLSPERSGRALGVRLGGFGASGREQLHYPDLLLVDPGGRRIAIELELSSKTRTRRERILTAYAADARTDAVVYLVQSRATGRAIQESARQIGISNIVHVQKVTGLGAHRQGARTVSRAFARHAAASAGQHREAAR